MHAQTTQGVMRNSEANAILGIVFHKFEFKTKTTDDSLKADTLISTVTQLSI